MTLAYLKSGLRRVYDEERDASREKIDRKVASLGESEAADARALADLQERLLDADDLWRTMRAAVKTLPPIGDIHPIDILDSMARRADRADDLAVRLDAAEALLRKTPGINAEQAAVLHERTKQILAKLDPGS